MHFPDSLPGRQTFLYAFLMLAVSYEAFLHFKGTRFLDVIAAGVASVGLMAVSYHFSDGTILGESAATATYVFLGSYIVVLLIYFYAGGMYPGRCGKKDWKDQKCRPGKN